MIDDFNKSSDWVISTIFFPDEMKERANRLNWMIELCDSFINLKNFYGMAWVYSTIESVAVFQLINSKHITLKTSSKEIMKKVAKYFENNYALYRESIIQCLESSNFIFYLFFILFYFCLFFVLYYFIFIYFLYYFIFFYFLYYFILFFIFIFFLFFIFFIFLFFFIFFIHFFIL